MTGLLPYKLGFNVINGMKLHVIDVECYMGGIRTSDGRNYIVNMMKMNFAEMILGLNESFLKSNRIFVNRQNVNVYVFQNNKWGFGIN